MGKHLAPKPVWHSRRYFDQIPAEALHVAVFTHYPRKVVAQTQRQGLIPHLAPLRSQYHPYRYMLWTTRP